MNIKLLQQIIDSFDEAEFTGGVSDMTIRNAEESLGVLFPPDYRDFLRGFGSGFVSSEEFVGLGGAKHLDVVWLTLDLRNRRSSSGFTQSLIPIRSDGYGNYDCIDTAQPTLGSEYKVIEWLHDADEQHKPRTLANSYGEWFEKMLSDIRRLDSESET